MLEKLISLALVTVICASTFVVSAAVPSNDDGKQADKTTSEVRKLGTGPDASIELELKDKTKIKGYVSQASDVDFVVVDPKSGTSTTVAYPQVKQAKGNNLSGGVKIALIVGAVVALTYLSFKYGRRNRRYGF